MNSPARAPLPTFCQYASGPCDQSLAQERQKGAFFAYPSDPPIIAGTIEATVTRMRTRSPEQLWFSWRDLQIAGRVIFCTICKTIRSSNAVVADVTTLNFNVLFEIGIAIGLQVPVIPIRDTSIIRDKQEFSQLGILDTLGYIDFQNAEGLANQLKSVLHSAAAIPLPITPINAEAPLYVVKSHIQTEGEIHLLSTLSQSALNCVTYDPIESRLSLHEAIRRVAACRGLVAHLLLPERAGANVHNARCAFLAGIAVAMQKSVLLLQEGSFAQPIDYRDIVKSYDSPTQVSRLVAPTLKEVIGRLQTDPQRTVRTVVGQLQKLDVGDVAAENEVRHLPDYFVRTGQYNEALRGHARLVVGRKGAGKTAIFYSVRSAFRTRRSSLVLDLKPEGHQFTTLREVVLDALKPGLQEHTLTALWNAILLSELAHKIVTEEGTWAQRDPSLFKAYNVIAEVYRQFGWAEEGDFSERLLQQVDRVMTLYIENPAVTTAAQITSLLFSKDIPVLRSAVFEYAKAKDTIWLLVDNLDKGWPTRGSSSADVLILRTLLDATRKLQHQFEKVDTGFHSLVFMRNDIYEHLLRDTPDKGKDTAIYLNWDDPDTFREMVRLRLAASLGKASITFQDAWRTVFDEYIGTDDAFRFVLERTLMRPRDMLNFLHRAIEIAVNRGHDRVLGDDFLKAEETYSNQIVASAGFELQDVYPQAPDLVHAFLGCSPRLTKPQAEECLVSAGVPGELLKVAMDLLVWYGILGVALSDGTERFSYQVGYDLRKLWLPVERDFAQLVIHKAFRTGLDIG